MIKLVVFDWNGVLIADTAACHATDNHVLKHFGGKPVNIKTYRDTIVIPAIEFYSQHGCKKETLLKKSDELGKVFHAFYEPRASKVRTRIGAKDILKWLEKNGIKKIILSNHTIDGINIQLRRLRINQFFPLLLANSSGETSMKKRNKFEKLALYIKERKLNLQQILIIGDSPEEIEIGKRLGIHTVAIINGFYATWRLKEKNPEFVISNLNQLRGIIDKLS